MSKQTGNWFSAWGVCTEYFIIGNPNKLHEAFVFERNTQTGDVMYGPMNNGVFDDSYRARAMPKWVKDILLHILMTAHPPKKHIQYKKENCEHPPEHRSNYHDQSVLCKLCNCVIEQYGKAIENPHGFWN